MKHHEVIVVGAGHAGVEAAWAAARMGRDVAICTLTMDTIAHMPCNPAIGGTAKGHLVREIDALGGLMGTAIDATAIQFKLLNRSRGPAVWSPRAQADKRVYSAWVRAALEREPNISWIVGRAGRILVENGRVSGLSLEDGERYRCDALVVTTGTFLNGLIHVGPDRRPAGRAGEPPSRDLAESLKSFGFSWGRLKTGTPPRLHRRSIDFSRFAEERGDDPPVPSHPVFPPRAGAGGKRGQAGQGTGLSLLVARAAHVQPGERARAGGEYFPRPRASEPDRGAGGD